MNYAQQRHDQLIKARREIATNKLINQLEFARSITSYMITILKYGGYSQISSKFPEGGITQPLPTTKTNNAI